MNPQLFEDLEVHIFSIVIFYVCIVCVVDISPDYHVLSGLSCSQKFIIVCVCVVLFQKFMCLFVTGSHMTQADLELTL